MIKRTAPLVKKSTNNIIYTVCWYFKSPEKIPADKDAIFWTAKTKLFDESNIAGPKPGNTFNYLQATENYLFFNIYSEIEQLSIFSSSLPPDYLEAIYDLKRCTLFDSLKNYPTHIFEWSDQEYLSYFDDGLLDLLRCCRNLKFIHDKNYGK
jgi:hypothetical protein